LYNKVASHPLNCSIFGVSRRIRADTALQGRGRFLDPAKQVNQQLQQMRLSLKGIVAAYIAEYCSGKGLTARVYAKAQPETACCFDD
jgi:hypothetical protein